MYIYLWLCITWCSYSVAAVIVVYWTNCATYKWYILKSNTVMYFLVHSLWSITSAKLSRISIQLSKHVIVLQNGRKFWCPYCVCAPVRVCVWFVPVATKRKSLFESLCGLFPHANQPVFSGVCCLNQKLHGVYMCSWMCICGHLSVCMCARSVSCTFLHVCVCVGFTLPCPVRARQWVYGAAAWAFLLTLSS